MDDAATPAIAAATGGEVGDERLMSGFARGDADAFDALYERYRGPVFRYFARQLAEADAEEAHQEAWLRVIRARNDWREQGEGSFRRYLFTLAHNVIVDRYRRQARRPQHHAGEDPDAHSADVDTPAQVHHAQLAERLYAAIARLPFAQREALVLHEETGMTYAQIAAVTDATPEGVKSRLRYAMRKLRAELARYADDT
jgi:RNA polymerase sigma factor (sigma-70 family)